MKEVRLAAAVFVLVLAAGQLAVGMRASTTSEITGDEPFYLLTTQSLVSDGDLDTRDEYRTGEYRRFWRASVALWTQMSPTEDGRLLVPHDPGLSVLVLPAYEWWGVRGVQRFLVVLWAVAMGAAAVVARRFGAPTAAAGLGAVVAGAACPGIVYGSQIYPEGPAALCVSVALLAITGRPRRALTDVAVVALSLTGLAWLGAKYVPLGAVVFAAWAWSRRRDRGRLVAAAASLALSGAAYVWWHFHVFDGLTPYATNIIYSGEGSAAIVDQHVTWSGRNYRLYGLFLDARFGLLRWLPAIAVSLWGVGRRTILPAVIVAAAVLIATFVSITMMGWWFPGRMLIAAWPAVAVLLALGAARVPITASVLSAWSFVIAAVLVRSARTGGVRLAVDPFDLGAPLAPAAVFPDFRRFGAKEVTLSALWLAALALWRVGPRLVARRRDVRIT